MVQTLSLLVGNRQTQVDGTPEEQFINCLIRTLNTYMALYGTRIFNLPPKNDDFKINVKNILNVAARLMRVSRVRVEFVGDTQKLPNKHILSDTQTYNEKIFHFDSSTTLLCFMKPGGALLTKLAEDGATGNLLEGTTAPKIDNVDIWDQITVGTVGIRVQKIGKMGLETTSFPKPVVKQLQTYESSYAVEIQRPAAPAPVAAPAAGAGAGAGAGSSD